MRTSGWLFLALQQVQDAEAPVRGALSIFELIADASPVSKAALLVLLAFSVVSWGIILSKAMSLSRAERQTRSFLDVFHKSAKFSEVQGVCKSLEHSPLVGVFQAGYAELNLQLRPDARAAGSPATTPPRPTLRSLAALDRALLRASSAEVNKLERRVTFLATTASLAPFVGLFGTVWGIMTAFAGIGAQGSTDLAVVAPGIAEALVATAVGLFAAMPAVYFYNAFTSRVKVLASEMDDFALEFLNISERHFGS
ncbi:MAG: MotA/TolQ/ExbB proton channel family protein [Vicinamibacterales bacterium]